MHFSVFVWQESADDSLLSSGGGTSPPGIDCLSGGKQHSSTICYGLIQAALEQGRALEYLQCIDGIILWGNTAEEAFEKGKRIIEILLQAVFAIKQSEVKGPAQEIRFLGVTWQDGRGQILMDVINKLVAMSAPTRKRKHRLYWVL